MFGRGLLDADFPLSPSPRSTSPCKGRVDRAGEGASGNGGSGSGSRGAGRSRRRPAYTRQRARGRQPAGGPERPHDRGNICCSICCAPSGRESRSPQLRAWFRDRGGADFPSAAPLSPVCWLLMWVGWWCGRRLAVGERWGCAGCGVGRRPVATASGQAATPPFSGGGGNPSWRYGGERGEKGGIPPGMCPAPCPARAARARLPSPRAGKPPGRRLGGVCGRAGFPSASAHLVPLEEKRGDGTDAGGFGVRAAEFEHAEGDPRVERDAVLKRCGRGLLDLPGVGVLRGPANGRKKGLLGCGAGRGSVGRSEPAGRAVGFLRGAGEGSVLWG